MKKILFSILVCCMANAQAGVIIASSDSNINSSNNNTFFNNVFGNQNVIGLNSTNQSWALDNWDSVATQTAASYSQSTTVSSASLAGADWLIAASASTYNAGTLQVINDFLVAGGNLWVGGEASVYGAYTAANQLLSALGSSMSLNPVATNSYNTSTNTGLDAYTSGTSSFSAAYTSSVNGGTAMYSSNGNSVLSIDRTTFDSIPVPEPTPLMLLSLGLAGLVFSRKKKYL